MTGEMFTVDEEVHSDMFEIAETLQDEDMEASVRPFDKYQGPYVQVGKGLRIGTPPYQLLTPTGKARIWYGRVPGSFLVERINRRGPNEVFRIRKEDIHNCRIEDEEFVCEPWTKVEQE